MHSKFCIIESLGIIVLILIIVPTHLHAQYITTIAGNGTGGYSGDGGLATASEIAEPTGICTDSTGDVIFSDYANYRIRMIDNAGRITTVAGTGVMGTGGDGGAATAATIESVGDLAIDRWGSIYLSELSENRIRKVDRYGIITTYAGTGVAGYSGDGGPATNAEINSSLILTTDTSGNLYLSQSLMQYVRMVNTSGIITTIAGIGTSGFSGDGGPATNAQFYDPSGLATDRKGNIYIGDELNYRIRKIDHSGIITTICGTGTFGFSGDGGPATAAEVSEVGHLFVDIYGNILFEDSNNDRVRRIDTNGIITTIAGGGTGTLGDGGPATAARLGFTFGVTRFGKGNIYISDFQDQRIRMIITKPFYVNGPVQHLTMCGGTLGLDTALAANDSNSGNRETWRLIAGPHHGTASIGYSTISTGNTLYPAGQSYTSNPGYTGADTLVVLVTDSVISDTTTLYLNIEGSANAGVLTGPDTVCRPNAITLTDTVSGGLWSATNSHATVTAGVVTGVTSGPDTIRYTTTNACGPTSATWVVLVKGCQVAVPEVGMAEEITIYPNPCRGVFTIAYPQTNGPDPAHLKLTDMLGRTIRCLPCQGGEAVCSGIEPGIYLVSLTTDNYVWYGKIVVTE